MSDKELVEFYIEVNKDLKAELNKVLAENRQLKEKISAFTSPEDDIERDRRLV